MAVFYLGECILDRTVSEGFSHKRCAKGTRPNLRGPYSALPIGFQMLLYTASASVVAVISLAFI